MAEETSAGDAAPGSADPDVPTPAKSKAKFQFPSAVATLAIVIFSRIGSGPSNAMHKRFDEAEQEYQDAHL